jgi:hypothetical protein
VSDPVVPFPLELIREHLLRLVDPLHPLRIPAFPVRMMAPHLVAVRTFDLVSIGRSIDAEHLVERLTYHATRALVKLVLQAPVKKFPFPYED